MQTYPIVEYGVFNTIQGEGQMIGLPMSFIRLAGCSIGCNECDTDYSVGERLSIAEIIERLQRLPRRQWVWLTGGEPTDHDILPLTKAIRAEGYRVAMPTAGHKFLGHGWNGWWEWCDHLHVSPHNFGKLKQTTGNVLNLVPGLNGLRLDDLQVTPDGRPIQTFFPHHYVTPLWGESLSRQECLHWLMKYPNWRMGIQAHKYWNIP